MIWSGLQPPLIFCGLRIRKLEKRRVDKVNLQNLEPRQGSRLLLGKTQG